MDTTLDVPDADGTAVDLTNATVLLTGGTGTFGVAFARRMKATHPNTVVRIYSRDELKQSEMLEHTGNGTLRYFIGDIRNKTRLMRAMRGVDVVVHAAAMKQVPACEYNPFEAVQTNVLGAQHIVDTAIDAGVQKVVALSTDKAVEPVNIYGATKLCMEKIVVQGNAYSGGGTRLSCVRYGNVIGSRGSVVPVFRQQATEGRLRITDDRMTRFWITVDQAVDLVLHAIDRSVGGEIFVPKIPSMRITDLAEAIAPGLPVEITGIRPGEKLHEVLLTADEARHAIDDGAGHYVVLPEHPFWMMDDVTGKPLDADFQYASHLNDEWLSIDELRHLVDG
ncbi:MAG: UDP-N-acetylglucosamine 4,6-dehydratase (inverting) [Actinomycetota bacterium]